MKSRSSRRYPSAILLTAVAAAIGLSTSHAITLTYDANITNPGAQDGAGAGWNVAPDPANWVDSMGTNVTWSTANTTADTAIFGAAPTGVGGAVVVGTVSVGTIQFNSTTTTGYTLNTGTITLGSGITTNQGTLTSTISARITGTNGLAFVGVSGTNGAVTLSNNLNDYTGFTTASTGGRLLVSAANALGSSAGATASTLGPDYTQINSGSTVALNVLNGTFNEAFLISGSGPGGNTGSLRVAQSGTTTNSLIQLSANALILSNGAGGATFAGNLELGANTATISSFSGTNTISGVISGATGSITFAAAGGAGIYNITNANSFGGTTSIGRTVGIGNNAALGTSTLEFNGGAIQSTDATARTLVNRIGTFGASANVTFGQTAVQTGTLTFTDTNTSDLGSTGHTLTTNVNTSFANGFSGAGGAITKNGAAVLSLNGASTYTGATTVSAGTLLVNNTTGSGTGAGVVNVTTATLGGNGTLGGIAGATGAVTINNLGNVAPGNPAVAGGIGTLTIGFADFNRDMVFGAGSTLSIGIAGTTSDLLRMFGGLDLSSGTDTLAISGTLDNVTDYTIATYNPGGLLGTFNNVSGIDPSFYSVDYRTDSIVLVAIPEPSTALLGGLAVLFAFRRRRCA